jgi:hypothetical protein
MVQHVLVRLGRASRALPPHRCPRPNPPLGAAGASCVSRMRISRASLASPFVGKHGLDIAAYRTRWTLSLDYPADGIRISPERLDQNIKSDHDRGAQRLSGASESPLELQRAMRGPRNLVRIDLMSKLKPPASRLFLTVK